MKRLSKLLAALTAAGMTAVIAVSGASANEADAASCYIAVEKFSIGQGYVFAPTEVALENGDSALDLLKKAVGEENIIGSDGDWGYYIEGFADKDSGEVALADCVSAVVDKTQLSGRNSDGALKSYDYSSASGFMFLLNGESCAQSVDAYLPSDGDVIRICFSIYGYGSDVGIDNSSRGGSPSLLGQTSREELTRLIAQKSALSEDVSAAVAVISDLDSTQEQLDAAAELLNAPSEQPQTPDSTDENVNDTPSPEVDDNSQNAENPPPTGAAVALVMPAAILALICVNKKRR